MPLPEVEAVLNEDAPVGWKYTVRVDAKGKVEIRAAKVPPDAK